MRCEEYGGVTEVCATLFIKLYFCNIFNCLWILVKLVYLNLSLRFIIVDNNSGTDFVFVSLRRRVLVRDVSVLFLVNYS